MQQKKKVHSRCSSGTKQGVTTGGTEVCTEDKGTKLGLEG